MSDLTFTNNFTEFELDSNAYAAFDATSLRDLIIARLTDQNIFTDQIFEGSNISSMIDIIAYSYHVLLFYLNRTSNETLFSEAQIYENINKIVKTLNYKPIGYQTSTATFSVSGESSMGTGFYTIPRYSFINVAGIQFSFTKDISFTKASSDNELLTSISDEHLLYQGEYIEYPPQRTTGEDYETIIIATGKDTNIETNSVHVYVRDVNTQIISEFKEVDSLYISLPGDRVFEKRFNEDELYEIKFGNNVTGYKPNPGDTVFIYYIKSDGDKGVIQDNAIQNAALTLYTTPQFTDILDNIKSASSSYLTWNDIPKLKFTNYLPSTIPNEKENVAEIKENAPKSFRSQDRLITKEDFQVKIKRSFGNIITDIKVMDNASYVSGYLSYLDTDLGLTNPNLESRLLVNQANFANSTTFNNVYIIGVPRLENKTSTNIQSNFLSTAQKQLIKNDIHQNKVIGSEIVFSDPVYVAFDICGIGNLESPSTAALDNSQIIIIPEENIVQDKDYLKSNVSSILTTYFSNKNCELGMLIDFTQLSNDILNVDGVKSFYTTRTDDPTLKIEGLSLLSWNPVYDTADINVINQNTQLPDYKFPYWFDTQSIVNKIIVQ
jgi:hypothetical protein